MLNMLITFTVMAFLTVIICVVCQEADELIVYCAWGSFVYGCINLYSVIVINSIYKTFKEEYNLYKSKMSIEQPEDVDEDVDSALTFQRKIDKIPLIV